MSDGVGFEPLWGRPQTVFKAFMPMMRDRNADTGNAMRRNADTVNTIRSERRDGEHDKMNADTKR